MSIAAPVHIIRALTPGARRRALMLAVPGTAAATLTIWAAGQSVTGMNVRMASGPVTHVGALTVLVVSVVTATAAWVTRRVAERHLAHPRRTWVRLALGLLMLSLAGPLSAATTTATEVALVWLHLTAAAVLIAILAGPTTSTAPSRATR